MAMPLLALVIVLTFFFGKAMTDQQRVKAAARYVAWREIASREPGRGAYDAADAVDEAEDAFFADRASGTAAGFGTGPLTPRRRLVEAASDGWDEFAGWPPAGALIEQCVPKPWSRGVRIGLSAEFPSEVAAWRRFTGAIRCAHARDGVQWRRANGTSYLSPVRIQFLAEFDAVVQEMKADEQMRELADALESLYSQRW